MANRTDRIEELLEDIDNHLRDIDKSLTFIINR